MALRNDATPLRESEQDIRDRFFTAQDGTKPTEEQLETQRLVQSLIYQAAHQINQNIEDSVDKSNALRELQVALMWAGKAIFK